jgi:transposase
VSRRAIARGIVELDKPPVPSGGAVRKAGGGRKRTVEQDATLVRDLERLIEPLSRGDPESPLRWTCKSVRKLAQELGRGGHRVSHRLVAELLHELGYSLQANAKTLEGSSHPDRNAQFEHIHRKVRRFLRQGQPVISVDTKKKELVGDFKNGGRELRLKGDPEPVRVHDFVIPELGRVTPYGVYDVGQNRGWVSVGIDHDTATFAVESIRRWWRMDGKRHYREAQRLLICADSGGGNGSRQRAWKVHLQELSDETGMAITVCHYPPGTSKWNKIEHRLFSFISLNWKGKPLINFETVVNLIGGTRTRTGLKVKAILDTNQYETGVELSKKDMDQLHLTRHKTHPDWNYTLSPRPVC